MPPGTTPTYSNCSESDMRRPWATANQAGRGIRCFLLLCSFRRNAPAHALITQLRNTRAAGNERWERGTGNGERKMGNRYNQKSRGVAQPGSAPALGAGGRRFKSNRPDHFLPVQPGDIGNRM